MILMHWPKLGGASAPSPWNAHEGPAGLKEQRLHHGAAGSWELRGREHPAQSGHGPGTDQGPNAV